MLKWYVSDLDQNLLYTKTPIYLLIKQPDGSRKEEAVPNADFDKRIEDKENVRFHKNTDHSLREFRWSDKLIKYAFEAIESEAYAPSRRKFIIATIEGSPNHIDTAAGFTEEDYTKMHKKIIYEISWTC